MINRVGSKPLFCNRALAHWPDILFSNKLAMQYKILIFAINFKNFHPTRRITYKTHARRDALGRCVFFKLSSKWTPKCIKVNIPRNNSTSTRCYCWWYKSKSAAACFGFHNSKRAGKIHRDPVAIPGSPGFQARFTQRCHTPNELLIVLLL